MTHEEAIAMGTAAARKFEQPYVVYRLPAWPAEVFSVIAHDQVPPQAETFEVVGLPAAPQGDLF